MIDTLILDLYYAYGAWNLVPLHEKTRLCAQWLKERDAINDVFDNPDDCNLLLDLAGGTDAVSTGVQFSSMVRRAAIVQVRERWAEIERRTAA